MHWVQDRSKCPSWPSSRSRCSMCGGKAVCCGTSQGWKPSSPPLSPSSRPPPWRPSRPLSSHQEPPCFALPPSWSAPLPPYTDPGNLWVTTFITIQSRRPPLISATWRIPGRPTSRRGRGDWGGWGRSAAAASWSWAGRQPEEILGSWNRGEKLPVPSGGNQLCSNTGTGCRPQPWSWG